MNRRDTTSCVSYNNITKAQNIAPLLFLRLFFISDETDLTVYAASPSRRDIYLTAPI